MQIPAIHRLYKKNTKRQNTGLSLQSIFPDFEVFLRALGLLGEQETVALLEGHTVARVLIIGREASRVAVRRVSC